ncbi:helix-turn-helix domain-containing protein [Acinetobacter indicus]|uniref:helix-turn-helix domain-containing protein n=1 Tax=Acinetobacter indicus TaxID=756892 RepID=UPI00197BA40C|nr:helix-turn-helix domain-containing protein [Acinetobacter indicus]QSG85602.1 DNA-binding protein [Acinetobacter indicus]
MKTTQCEQILAHLNQCKTISPMGAVDLYNCYRLSAIIQRLRNNGHHIITHLEPNQTRRGSHARYELKVVTP